MKSPLQTLRRILPYLSLIMVPIFLTGCSLKTSGTSSTTAKQTLTIWRHKGDTPAEEQAFKAVISSFEQTHTNVKVVYQAFDPTEDYEKAVLNGLAAGTGPDIWEIREDELPRQQSKLSGLELTSDMVDYYKKNFTSAISQQLIADNKLYGMPLGIDPLVLFYNSDDFEKASIQTPPKTWNETMSDAQKLTVKADNIILRPGLALGTASNIDRVSDIVQLMMLQFNTQMTDSAHRTATFELYTQDPETKKYQYPGKTAFSLFASFANPSVSYQSWDKSQSYTTSAFAKGQLSMMIDYMSLAPQIKELNPNLNFQIARVPQWVTKKIPVGDLPAEVSDPVYTAKYKALVVSKPSLRLTTQQQTAQTNLAWQFISYAVQPAIASVYDQNAGFLTTRTTASNNNATPDASTLDILSHIQTWYKGPSPRTVDQIIFQMTQAITEKGLSIDSGFTQASQAVTGLMK